MGIQPALEAHASRTSAPPTFAVGPSPSVPLHTPRQTIAPVGVFNTYGSQHRNEAQLPLEVKKNGGEPGTSVMSESPRSSPAASAGDRRSGVVQEVRHNPLGRNARRPRGEGSPNTPLPHPGFSKGLKKRPRTRERRFLDPETHEQDVSLLDPETHEQDVSLDRRQWQIPQAEGYPSCYYVDLSIFTCYPESNTTLVQDDYSLVIWNSAQPAFIEAGYVDVYLYNADTQDVATSWRNESNAQGMTGIVPDDPWWPTGQTAEEWFGSNARNRSVPYFFVVVPSGDELTGGEVHGATFTAIQTAVPTSLASALAALTTSSLSSASSASLASISSLSSLSSLSAASLSSLLSGTNSSGAATSRTAGGGGSLQNDSSSGGPAIPNYAIALIVVLGFLALLAGAIAVYCCLGRGRRRRRQDEASAAAAAAAAGAGRRGASSGDLTDLGSAEPMLGGAAGGAGVAASAGTRGSRASSRAAPASGWLAGAGAGAGLGAAAAAAKEPEKEEDSTLSQSDAARMAEAFRAALRKPTEFAPPVPLVGSAGETESAASAAVGPGAGPSPTGAREGTDSSGTGGSSGEDGNGVGRGIMEEELRSEGKSMRSVEGGGKRWGRTG